jgi:hypothetical protein
LTQYTNVVREKSRSFQWRHQMAFPMQVRVVSTAGGLNPTGTPAMRNRQSDTAPHLLYLHGFPGRPRACLSVGVALVFTPARALTVPLPVNLSTREAETSRQRSNHHTGYAGCSTCNSCFSEESPLSFTPLQYLQVCLLLDPFWLSG